MRMGILGGSFDPVHIEHVRLSKAAIKELSLDRLFVVPSRIAPHKLYGAAASGEDRVSFLRLAFSEVPQAEISRFELEKDETSFSYLTCRHFAEKFPDAERFFLVGADMLEDFFTWREPEEILKNVTLAVCGRNEPLADRWHFKFRARFGCDFIEFHHIGEKVSSTKIRVDLAFEKRPEGMIESVYRVIRERGLYLEPQITEALKLEKPERREHSYRVALMACERAESLKIPFHKALLAAALHDCGKCVPPQSPLLKNFTPPDVPPPVLHQYVGAYLAKHLFSIHDEDVLNAIRYHTSGRPGMSELEKLIYLSDALEAGRDYEHVERLRELFWRDLDECLVAFLGEQIKYLKESGKPVYSLTEEANEWICALKNA